MKKFSCRILFTIFAVICSAFLVLAVPVITLSPVSPTVICSTGNDTLLYSVSASGIPANTNVVVYQNTDSTFNPYQGQGDSIGFIPGNAIPVDTVSFGSCVKIVGILIDACGVSGTEPQNEYIILTSGSGVRVNNLAIDYSSQNNAGATNADININANPCGYKIPNAALIASLRAGSCNASNIIPANPTDSIPPNAIILVFTSDSVTANYNVNGLCNLGHPIYVLQSSCTRTLGAFTNASNCGATRYRTTTATDKRQNCSNNFTYDLCNIFNKDGTYAIRQQGLDTASVANNGIRRNLIDSCGGLDYSQLNFNTDTILKFKIPLSFCNTGFHYIKAITHPNGSQPISNTIKFKLVCNDVAAVSNTTNICSGDSVKINISSTDPNAALSWTISGGAAITGAVAGSGNTIKQVLTYSGNTKDSVTYTAISNDAGCIKIQTVKVVVNKCLVCTPDFDAPDTVCVGANVTLTNLSANCATTNYWNFCSGNLNSTPAGTNLGNINSQFSSPVYVELVSDNNINYAFVVNHVTNGGAGNGQIVRLNYGSSYLNTPTVTNFGDLGITNNIKIEGIQIKKDANGNWYGFLCSGGESFSKIVRMSFGTSLSNTPTATDLGAIGNLHFPGGLYLFQESNNWYGFITNALNNDLVRLSFGTSLGNIPTATNTTVAGLNNLGEFTFVEENGNKYMFLNSTLAHVVNRLSFGNSYLNTPTLQSYSIPVNSDNYGIKLLRDCGTTFGFITHINNTITKMEFPNGLTSAPTFTNIGNIGGLDFPHSISNIFRVRDSVYMLIPNVNSNTLSRLVFGNCTNSSIQSSTLVNPPVYTYNQPGVYNVSLTVDEGLPTQTTVCKSIVAVNPVAKPDARINQITCSTDSIRLTVANIDNTAAYSWSGPNGFNSTKPNVSIKFTNANQAGQYIVTTTGRCGSKKDTVSFNAAPLQIFITGNNQLCIGSTDTLRISGQFDSIRWNTGATGSQIFVSIPGNYSVTAYVGACPGTSAVNVSSCTVTICNPSITGNTPFCAGDSIVLNAGGGFNQYSWSTGATSQTITVKTAGQYTVAVVGNNCTGRDSVNVIVNLIPQVNITGTTSICIRSSTVLTANATNIDSLRWNTNETTSDITVALPGNYSVTVYKNGCSSSASVQVSNLDPPAQFSLGNDTTYCGTFSKVLSTGVQTTVWSTGVTAAQITVSQAGTYTATISNACGTVEDAITIAQHDLPVADLGNDTAFCEGQIQLNAPGGFKSYVWSTGSQDTFIVVMAEDTYTLTVTDSNGCSNTSSISITSNCVNDIWMPNAFSPNGDGINDVFLVRGNPRNTTIEKFTIYNRVGNKVFESNNVLPGDIAAGWDGKYKGEPAQMEVYGYYVIAKFSNGDKKVMKGNVTLLR